MIIQKQQLQNLSEGKVNTPEHITSVRVHCIKVSGQNDHAV